MKKVLLAIVLIAVAATVGWYFGHQSHGHHSGETNGRKVAYYQSPMHPWIKSDKPGNCTICGMKLTPVYEGEKGLDIEGNVVTLSSNAINVLHVQTAPAELRPIERQLNVAGKIEAQEGRYKMLSAYVDGRIEKLFINYVGAEVQQGQPLAILYSPALLTAQREYLTALSQTNFASSPQLAPEHERLVEGARLRLRRLGLTDQQIAEIRTSGATNLTTQIVAPIGGTVVARAVVEGQYVKEGEKLFEIADLSQMWFRFDVYEQDLPSIQLGQVVRVTSPALGDKVFEGPITFIDPNINEMSRSARVRVELQNPVFQENGRERRVLYNGLYANGSIGLRTQPVLAVDRNAVLDPGDQPRVYVDKGAGAYEMRPVTLGAHGERFVEIREGLSPGEQVVTAGNLLLDSQAQINQAGKPHEPSAAQTN
jgi:Cu(I)/Ag(I) efflux system membrane fusion protein